MAKRPTHQQPNTPRTELDLERMLCDYHRGQVPDTARLTFGMKLFELAVVDSRIVADCTPKGAALAEASRLTRVIRRRSPLCCFLEPRDVKTAIAETLDAHARYMEGIGG